MNNPFIPLKKAKLVIVDGRMDKDSFKKLEGMGLKVIPTICCKEIHPSVAFHPDMVIHPVNPETLVIAPNVFEYYEKVLYGMGIKLIKGEKWLNIKYPNDIAYNVLRISKYALHNFKYIDKKLLFYLKKEKLEFININQGYSKCSTAIIDEKAIITSDYPIHKKMSELGIDSLLIRQGAIELLGFNYGLIGGCCGNISNNEIIFYGNVFRHPDGEKIMKFLNKYNKNVYFLTEKNLVDIGTIISL